MQTNFEFLIIGAGRGGTSLLMAVLDYHSKLEVISEFNSVKYLMRGNKENNTIEQRVHQFTASCIDKASEHPDKSWGNKITTEQLKGLSEISNEKISNLAIFDIFFQNLPTSTKKIFILRDGRSCTISKTNRTNQSMEKACERWNYSIEVYKYLKDDDTTLCIKFEELVLSPILTLIKISRFLNITYETNMLRGTSNKKLSPEYKNTGFVTEKATPPTIDKQYYQSIKENLKYCNYI